MESAIPLVRSTAIPLVRLVARAPAQPRPAGPEPSVIVDPAIYREAEEYYRGCQLPDVSRVARRLRTLINPPRNI